MTARLLGGLVAGLVLVTNLPAQGPRAVRIGDRVRVTAAGLEGRRTGTLTRLTADTLVVDARGIPRAGVTRLELGIGQRSRWLRGLGLGFAAGLTAGAIVGAAHPCLDGEFTQLWCAGFFGAVGAVAGAPIGALIGSGSHTERWRRLPIDRLIVTGGSTGLRLGFALPF